jgi:hypothetical protein
MAAASVEINEAVFCQYHLAEVVSISLSTLPLQYPAESDN